MSDNYAHFLHLVQNSETLSARWSGLVQTVIEDAAKLGATISPDDVLGIREVRNAALGASLDPDAYVAELKALPSISDVTMRDKIAAGDAEARSAALTDLNRADDFGHQHATAHRASKISRARDLGIASPAPVTDDSVSKAERLEMLKDIKDSATKLSLARKWGLI
jgi:hypothetical protein